MFTCPHCNRQYKHRPTLVRHLQTHADKPITHDCPHCAFKFQRRDVLQQHIRAVHEQPAHVVPDTPPLPPSEFKCPHCTVTFTRKNNRASHIKNFHPFAVEKRKLEEEEGESPVPKKKRKADETPKGKKRRRAKKNLLGLDDEGEEPPTFDSDDAEINAVLTANWDSLKSHTRVTDVSTFINVRWSENEVPDFEAALTPFFENSKNKVKVQASHGFVLKKTMESEEEDDEDEDGSTGNYRYFHSSDRNAGLYERPRVIGNSADFQELIGSLTDTDHLEVCRQERPSSKFTVDRITNTSFVIYPIREHPIGDGESPLPAYLMNKKGLVTLVKGMHGNDIYHDRKCFFRCLALYKNVKKDPQALEKRTDEYLQMFMERMKINHFDGVRMSELKVCERLFDVTIEVFEFEENLEDEPVLTCVRRSPCKNKHKPLQLLKYKDHFSYIKNIGHVTKSFMCAKCTGLFKRNCALTRHEPTCDGTSQRNTYVTGVYRPQPTPLETLRENGIDVDPGAVFPYRATFDFESYFEKNDLPKTKKENAKTFVTARHVPLSVSVCSNVPSFTDPKFLVNEGSEQDLIDAFVAYLQEISAKSFRLLKEQYAAAYDQLAVRQTAEEESPDARVGQSAQCLKKTLDAYLLELPVVGFNSGSYDLNVVKSTLNQEPSYIRQIVAWSALLLLVIWLF